MIEPLALASAQESLQATDSSESTLVPAPIFIENVYGDGPRSRAATPMIVRPDNSFSSVCSSRSTLQSLHLPGKFPLDSPVTTPKSLRLVSEAEETLRLKQR
jgi:hypothetical protein